MIARILLVVVFAALSFLAGWLNPPSTELPVTAVRPLRLNAPTVQTPGGAAAGAARYLADLNRPPPPPPPPRPPPPPLPPPPPPPPDPVVLLKAAMTAVVADPAGLHIVLSSSAATSGKQLLRVGDNFAGWKVKSIDRHQVVLQQGAQTRTASFFAASPRP